MYISWSYKYNVYRVVLAGCYFRPSTLANDFAPSWHSCVKKRYNLRMEFAKSYIRPLITGAKKDRGEYFPEYSTFYKIYKFSLTVIMCCFKLWCSILLLFNIKNRYLSTLNSSNKGLFCVICAPYHYKYFFECQIHFDFFVVLNFKLKKKPFYRKYLNPKHTVYTIHKCSSKCAWETTQTLR